MCRKQRERERIILLPAVVLVYGFVFQLWPCALGWRFATASLERAAGVGMEKRAAVLVAAGEGRRTGLEEPKQFCELGGIPVLLWSARVLSEHPLIGRLLVMLSTEYLHRGREILSGLEKVCVLPGGVSRSETVRLAVDYLFRTESPVQLLVHDAARPGLHPVVVEELFREQGSGIDGVAPALAVADALVRRGRAGEICSEDREGVYRVQTPQVFSFSALREALATVSGEYVDEMGLLRAAGFRTGLVTGDYRLAKITWEEDFAMLERLLLSQREGAPRVGTGFDVHAFAPGSGVVLCGVSIPHDRSLSGHSDADVGFHALTDAILGALSAGDIGAHFPPSEEEWRGAPSRLFLTHACELARQRGYVAGNVDLTFICEEPRIGEYRRLMRSSTAAVLGCGVDCVSIKATTTEGLGAIGRGEGIAVQAVVMLVR